MFWPEELTRSDWKLQAPAVAVGLVARAEGISEDN